MDGGEVDTVEIDGGPGETGDGTELVPATGWRRAVAIGLAAYLISRLCVITAAGVRAAQQAVDLREAGVADRPSTVKLMSEVLTSWDGLWYLEITRSGYPSSIPADVTYFQDEARAAFFPVFPLLVRAVDRVLPGGDTVPALLLNFVLGALSVVLVGLLARRLHSDRVAARAMVIFALFPGSFVLSFAYAEALFVVLAALCLLLLLDERWLLAGITAALATATRPNGLALVVACLVASVLAIRRTRAWSSLVAVVLAPIGFLAFQVYIDQRTDERGAWFRVQREAWSEGTSFGATALKNTWSFLANPLESTTDAITAVSIFTLAFMLWCARRKPLPAAMLAYSIAVVTLMILPETVTARPRFVFTAFPLFIAVAAWWPTADDSDEMSWPRVGWDLTLVLEGVGLVVLTGLYGALAAIP